MDLYWDYNERELVTGLADAQVPQRFDVVLRDTLSLNLYLVTASNGVYTAAAAPTGWTPKLAIKPESDLVGANRAFVGAWTWDGTNSRYQASLELNDAALIAEVEEATENYADFLLELTLQDANGKHRDSTQVDVRVLEDVYRGTEASPAAAEGPWPNFEWYTNADTGEQCLRIKNDAGQTLALFKPAGV